MKVHLTVNALGSTNDTSIDVTEGATVGDVANTVVIESPAAGAAHTLRVGSTDIAADEQFVTSGIRSGATVEVVPWRGGVARHASSTASLCEMDDPLRTTHPLGPGENVIGRAAHAQVRLADTSLSRHHARITIRDSVTVTDLGSTNGTIIDGTGLAPEIAQPARDGSIIQVGDVRLLLTLGGAPGTAMRVDGPVLYFNRPPRTEPRYPGDRFKAPVPPEAVDPEPIAWAMAAIPLVMAGMVYLIGRQATTQVNIWQAIAPLTFALMSPAMVLGSWFQNRRNARRKYERRLQQFLADVEQLNDKVSRAQRTEVTDRRQQARSTSEMISRAGSLDVSLWNRGLEDSDFLLVRVGQGDQPSIVTIEIPDGGDRDERAAIETLLTRYEKVTDVPVEADLRAGGLGFAGDRGPLRDAVRSFIVQIAGLHSPAEVAVAALLSEEEGPAWEWLKWLPHTRFPRSPLEGDHLAATPAACSDLMRRLLLMFEARPPVDGPGEHQMRPWLVLLVDDDARVDRPMLDALLRAGTAHGVSFVWMASHQRNLPRLCHSVVDLDASDPVLTFSISGHPDSLPNMASDRLAAHEAEAFARRLAPVQDISARVAGELDLPPVVLLSDLLDGEDILGDPSRVASRWRANDGKVRCLETPVGQAPGQPRFTLDIVRQGPHGFMIGTTGSGKSELLRTLLVSLAATHGPERVNFLLIDFKGGAALRPFLDLPHTIGLVTNLRENESSAEEKLEAKIRRTIVWLRAESQRRMKILDDHRVSDIADLEKLCDGSDPARPRPADIPARMLIVADEFAVLANRNSTSGDDVVDEIVTIARVGRSLGIHLLLATQRATGVISDNISANTNLRIALRVQDVAESMDVVKAPDAAKISLATPGRAFVSVGAGSLTQMQTASSTGHTSALRTAPKVRLEPFTFLGRAPTPAPIPTLPMGSGPNDLEQLIETAACAAATWELPQPDTHWDEPPGDIVPLSTIGSIDNDFVLSFGVLDDPANQTIRTATFDMRASGHLLVYGTGGSGKTVVLRTIAAQIADRMSPDDVRIIGLDCAGHGLDPLDKLPQTYAVVNSDDSEQTFRLFRELRRLINTRSARFAQLKVADLAEYRQRYPDGEDRAIVLVLLDGLGGFVERFEKLEGGALVEQLAPLLIDARSAGVHFVMATSRRGGIPMAVIGAAQERLVLRMASVDEYNMVDIRTRDIPIEPPAGRGLYQRMSFQAGLVTTASDAARLDELSRSHSGEALEAYDKFVLEISEGERQAAAFDELAARLSARHPVRGERMRRLAERVLPADAAAQAGRWQAIVGIGDLRFAPAVLDLSESNALVSGPPRCGKSTALLTIATSLRSTTPGLQTVLVATRQSPATASATAAWDRVLVTDTDVELCLRELLDELEKSPERPRLLCLDDYTDFDDYTVGAAFAALFARAKRGSDMRFVLASEARALNTSFNDAVKGIKRFRTGLLLQPDIDLDGDLLGMRLPQRRWQQYPPGRGYLVQRSAVELVQTIDSTGDFSPLLPE